MPSPGSESEVDASEYMLRLAESSMGQGYKAAALALLGLQRGNAVLDLGCGPGADLPDYAKAVGPDGSVVGIDRDATAVADARRRTVDLAQVQVRRGDVHRLDVPGSTFDAVHTDRVLQHVADPGQAIKEAIRVLKPGGRAVFAEPDWRTLVIDHPDHRLSDAFTRFVTDHQIRNARLGSQLLRLCESAGFEEATSSRSRVSSRIW